jgi:hypothetical protein
VNGSQPQMSSATLNQNKPIQRKCTGVMSDENKFA